MVGMCDEEHGDRTVDAGSWKLDEMMDMGSWAVYLWFARLRESVLGCLSCCTIYVLDWGGCV